MKQQTIKKSIEINASRESVWEVLLNDKFTRTWYAEFSAGTHAETDWKIGSKAVFTDDSKAGLISTVIANKPLEFLSLEYAGIVTPEGEDYESELARSLKGGRETYQLTEVNSNTRLSVECDMSEDMFEGMSSAWDKALQKIKTLSEPQKELQL